MANACRPFGTHTQETLGLTRDAGLHARVSQSISSVQLSLYHLNESGFEAKRMYQLQGKHLMNGNYRHTQRALLCLLVYGTAVMFFVLDWVCATTQ